MHDRQRTAPDQDEQDKPTVHWANARFEVSYRQGKIPVEKPSWDP